MKYYYFNLMETMRVTEALEQEGTLEKTITSRAMRRTFQDLARTADVKDIVTRAISGHATEGMQRLYSTVHAVEIEEAIGKVVPRARLREAMVTTVGQAGGQGGWNDCRNCANSKT